MHWPCSLNHSGGKSFCHSTLAFSSVVKDHPLYFIAQNLLRAESLSQDARTVQRGANWATPMNVQALSRGESSGAALGSSCFSWSPSRYLQRLYDAADLPWYPCAAMLFATHKYASPEACRVSQSGTAASAGLRRGRRSGLCPYWSARCNKLPASTDWYQSYPLNISLSLSFLSKTHC